MSEVLLKTKPETESWAQEMARKLSRPAVILLDGDLGAGKTQIARWMISALGVGDTASPTFAIHHEYRTPTGEIDHVDLYRLKSDTDLESSGFWDILKKPNALLIVEWASRLPRDVWPFEWTKIFIKISKLDNSEEGRRIEIG